MERAEFTCELIHLTSKKTNLPGPIIVFPTHCLPAWRTLCVLLFYLNS
jgi:hypothetical protein